MKSLETLSIGKWDEKIPSLMQDQAIKALEAGKILFFPSLPFVLSQEETAFLSPHQVDPKSKNISYDRRTDHLGGSLLTGNEAQGLKEMIKRYAIESREFLDRLIPHYSSSLIQGKTSFRPVEIAGRKTSYRKDDTRLHVDAFPSNPTRGRRILRLFTNVNPHGKSRVWRTGESFEAVAKRFAPQAPQPFPGFAPLLKFLRITKDLRSPYDHYMLHIHDKMKADLAYQQAADQEEIHFPPGTSWMVYTDLVSHAALSGQHVFEQTFNLPLNGLKDGNSSPIRQLEKILNKPLI